MTRVARAARRARAGRTSDDGGSSRDAAEARACGCAGGGDARADAAFAAGVAATREAVATLNALVVDALRARGVDAVGVSPSRAGWRTRGIGVEDAAASGGGAGVLGEVKRGRVPVTHGDVCEDSTQGTSVLSGDDIVAWCAAWAVRDGSWRDVRVVFCSDVFGVYSATPSARVVVPDDPSAPLRIASDETAMLCREIVVDETEDGEASPSWRVVRASPLVALHADASASELPAAAFSLDPDVADVTGGLEAKLARAMDVARALHASLPRAPLPRVYLTRAGRFAAAADAPPRDHALDAILGRFRERDDVTSPRTAHDAPSIRDFVGTTVSVRDARDA